MNFRSLEIKKDTWGDKSLTGQVVFDNEKGRINLNLTESHINKIFSIVADSMIDVAKEAAQELTCNIIEHKNSLTNKEDI